MSNEAERMRAKIEGKLNCRNCINFHSEGDSWCHKKSYAPHNTEVIEYQYCEMFKLRNMPITVGIAMRIFLDPKFK